MELCADVIVIGGSVGGCAAALAAARMGRTVILTEETDWIGGQFTSQAVPPDENSYIETIGGTRLYQEFRGRIRDYYRRNYSLSDKALTTTYLNPGNGFVSRLCHDGRVALAVFYEMLAPYLHSGRIRLMLEVRPTSAEVDGDEVRSVTVKHVDSGETTTLAGPLFVDATELGDLLPLTGTEYVTGSESQNETGELHAPASWANPLNMQAITYCFAVDYVEGADFTIDTPSMYPFWREYVPDVTPAWPGKLLSWVYPSPATLEPRAWSLFTGDGSPSLWTYRRLIDKDNFVEGTFDSDISLVNWPQNDYLLGPVCEVSDVEVTERLREAKQLSLSLLYWMQTEAPRPDGGVGYPGLRLRPDVTGTVDGLAKAPYIRESRRIRAQFTVREEHVGLEMLGGHEAASFQDSVGIGHYNIDLHPSTVGDNYIDVPTAPFQIPLGSLLPVRVRNLLPACKNIGVTHITNGCYRLHPVEWNIGEAVGYLAAYCLQHDVDPQGVRTDRHLPDFQRLLDRQGILLRWPGNA